MRVDDYVNALELELCDQPRRVRRAEAADLREHLEELPDDALERLEPPAIYAHQYRRQRGLRTRKVRRTWRRMSRLVRVAMIALVFALLAAAIIPPWVTHYQPVTAGIFAGGPNGAPGHEEHDASVYEYRDGAVIRFDMEFRNSGRVDATITGFDDSPEFGVLKFAGLRVWEKYPAGCCLPEKATPAQFPLRVPARSTRAIHLELRMTNCEYYSGLDPGDAGSVGYHELRFPMKILGVHHVVTTPLSKPVFIDMPGPKTRYCPRADPLDPPSLEPLAP
jgi:hypothetical protein